MFISLMEFVKVELQKISIYLCRNTWMRLYQLHVITTCSVWGQACKQRDQEAETDARQQQQQRRSLRSTFWDGTLLPSSAKRLFSRLARQQVHPAGWPGAAAFGAELLLRHHSGYEAKKVELNRGVKTCHATPGSQEHRTVTAHSRAGA